MDTMFLSHHGYNVLVPSWIQCSCPIMDTMLLSHHGYNVLVPSWIQCSCTIMDTMLLSHHGYNVIVPSWIQCYCATVFNISHVLFVYNWYTHSASYAKEYLSCSRTLVGPRPTCMYFAMVISYMPLSFIICVSFVGRRPWKCENDRQKLRK